jgi:dienelactone hydrolase
MLHPESKPMGRLRAGAKGRAAGWRRLGRVALLGALLLVWPRAWAGGDPQEQLVRIPVTVKALWGGTQTRDMPITLYRPQGPGPFPLLVLSHGRAGSSEQRAKPGIVRFESQARFFVRKGFMVLVPTRIGYGETGQGFDPEDSGTRKSRDYQWTLGAAATEILAAAAYGRTLPGADGNRVVLVGQSVGGMATVAAAAQNPPGVVAAINFAGGSGGDPDRHPGVPTDGGQLKRIFEALGKTARVPMLWVYTENDRYFAPEYSQAWAKAFGASGGQVEYRLLPPFRDNGHELFAKGSDIWMPLVDAYLDRIGFTAPGLEPRPEP